MEGPAPSQGQDRFEARDGDLSYLWGFLSDSGGRARNSISKARESARVRKGGVVGGTQQQLKGDVEE